MAKMNSLAMISLALASAQASAALVATYGNAAPSSGAVLQTAGSSGNDRSFVNTSPAYVRHNTQTFTLSSGITLDSVWVETGATAVNTSYQFRLYQVTGANDATLSVTGSNLFSSTQSATTPATSQSAGWLKLDVDNVALGSGTYAFQFVADSASASPFPLRRFSSTSYAGGAYYEAASNGATPTAMNSGVNDLKFAIQAAASAVPTLAASPVSGSVIDAGAAIEQNTPSTLTDAISLSNTGTSGSQISVTGFAITGDDASLFSVPDFATTTLTAGGTASVLYDVAFAGAATNGTYDASLVLNTSSGNVSYSLTATVVPEPAFAGALGIVTIGAARRRRR